MERLPQNQCLIHQGKNTGGYVQKDMIVTLPHQAIEYVEQVAQYVEIKKYQQNKVKQLNSFHVKEHTLELFRV